MEKKLPCGSWMHLFTNFSPIIRTRQRLLFSSYIRKPALQRLRKNKSKNYLKAFRSLTRCLDTAVVESPSRIPKSTKCRLKQSLKQPLKQERKESKYTPKL